MDHSTSKNSVTLDPQGIVAVKLVGKQDFLSMEDVGKECNRLAETLHARNKPVLGLVDFTDDPNFDAGTNKAVLKALEEIPYDKAALFGTNELIAAAARAVLLALGKGKQTKIFQTREEALAWLLTADPVHGY